MIRIIYLFLGLFILFGCKKSEDRSCFKSGGEHTVKIVDLEPFQKLELGPRIRYVLVQDTVEKIVISGGENLVNFIESNIENDVLTIKNANKCNFLRNFNLVVTVEVHFKSIYNVLFEGTKKLTCKNQLNLPYLTFVIRDGAGFCDLNVKSERLIVVVTNGWGNFDIKGETGYLKMDIRTNGFGSTYNLNVLDSLNILASSSELLKINADGVPLRAELSSYGNVWYIGNPTSIEYNQYGEGELVNKN